LVGWGSLPHPTASERASARAWPAPPISSAIRIGCEIPLSRRERVDAFTDQRGFLIAPHPRLETAGGIADRGELREGGGLMMGVATLTHPTGLYFKKGALGYRS
jgi:hypothetical protein